MEVKINKEIRNYTESMFFGLSRRQFIFSVLACGVAVGLYFLLNPQFGTETLSWMCILGGFSLCYDGLYQVQWHDGGAVRLGMDKIGISDAKEDFIFMNNLFYETMKPTLDAREKGLPPSRRKRSRRRQK